jgi:hypothetical protein
VICRDLAMDPWAYEPFDWLSSAGLGVDLGSGGHDAPAHA